MIIDLKFAPEMVDLIIQGKKSSTIRLQKRGSPGDCFIVHDRVYRILSVVSDEIRHLSYLYELEGFRSPDLLYEALTRYYPSIRWDTTGYLYLFAYAGSAPKSLREEGEYYFCNFCGWNFNELICPCCGHGIDEVHYGAYYAD